MGFMNSPTQTCALCTTAQPYCVPTSQVPRCRKQQKNAQVTPAIGGGVDHGWYQNDFDWEALAHKKYDSSEVCIGEDDQCYPIEDDGYLGSPCGVLSMGEHDQCYPVKDNGYMGTPCGVLSMGDPQGCFMNSPTQTCALCTTAQPYCVPTSQVPRCRKQKKNAQ